jgi:hypothetical protein
MEPAVEILRRRDAAGAESKEAASSELSRCNRRGQRAYDSSNWNHETALPAFPLHR